MEKSVFDQPVKSDRRTYDNMICLLHYVHFKNYYKMKAINLGKQQAIEVIQRQYNKLIPQEI